MIMKFVINFESALQSAIEVDETNAEATTNLSRITRDEV